MGSTRSGSLFSILFASSTPILINSLSFSDCSLVKGGFCFLFLLGSILNCTPQLIYPACINHSILIIQGHPPQIRNILYDADTQRFYNKDTGRTYSDQALKNIAKIKQSRSANAGLATIKRTAIANTILQGTVQEGRGRVIQEASRERLGNGMSGVLCLKLGI